MTTYPQRASTGSHPALATSTQTEDKVATPVAPPLGTLSGIASWSPDCPGMRRRDLTADELAVLKVIQQGYGPENSLRKVFFTDTGEAAIFVIASTGASILMANLTNLATWHADGRISSDEELKRDWLLLPEQDSRPLGSDPMPLS